MAAVDVDGQPIHYDEYGSGDDVLVWLHCFGGSARMWKPIIEQFPDYRSIAIDIRGHGRSAHSVDQGGEIGVGFPRLARDVYQLMQVLGIGRFIVIGHSIGGGIAIRLAVDHPEVLRAAISISGQPAGGQPKSDEIGEVLDGYLVGMRDPEIQRKAVEAGFIKGSRFDGIVDGLVEDGLVVSELFFTSWLRGGLAWESFEDELGRIRTPTTLIAGGHDPNVPIDCQLKSALKVPDGRVVVLNDEGHFIPWESPERCVAELRLALDGASKT
jgi:pimeloyl-ACP methyl ester carboxylesterase